MKKKKMPIVKSQILKEAGRDRIESTNGGIHLRKKVGYFIFQINKKRD